VKGQSRIPVSYTHLDVYKRQHQESAVLLRLLILLAEHLVLKSELLIGELTSLLLSAASHLDLLGRKFKISDLRFKLPAGRSRRGVRPPSSGRSMLRGRT